jgi:hypothetical protein
MNGMRSSGALWKCLGPIEEAPEAPSRQPGPGPVLFRSFSVLDKLSAPYARGPGGIICNYEEPVSLGGEDRVIPAGYL